MATRQLLGELAAMYRQQAGVETHIESVGGVDAARRVQAGEPFDVVFLASDAIATLQEAGQVVAGTRVDLARSGVGIAVKAGAPRPDVGSEDALRRAVLAAPSLGYSTGPSGTALLRLFERWGLADTVRDKLVQAPPGVPVGSLVAEGRAALGFQQLSELVHQPGIAIVGAMPPPVEITTVFCGAACASGTQRGAVRELLHFMASAATADAKRRHGMEPA